MIKYWNSTRRRVSDLEPMRDIAQCHSEEPELIDTLLQQTTSTPSNQPSTAPSLLFAGSAPMAFAFCCNSGMPNDRSSGYQGVGCRATWSGCLHSQGRRGAV